MAEKFFEMSKRETNQANKINIKKNKKKSLNIDDSINLLDNLPQRNQNAFYF